MGTHAEPPDFEAMVAARPWKQYGLNQLDVSLLRLREAGDSGLTPAELSRALMSSIQSARTAIHQLVSADLVSSGRLRRKGARGSAAKSYVLSDSGRLRVNLKLQAVLSMWLPDSTSEEGLVSGLVGIFGAEAP